MVSLLSFFQSKKKSKRSGASSPTSPSTSTSARAQSSSSGPSTPTIETTATGSRPSIGGTGRFLSLRHKPGSSKPYDPSSRRASSEISRKRSQVKASSGTSSASASASARQNNSNITLPKLDLGFNIPSPGPEGSRNDLGLHGVGEKAILSREEVAVLGKIQLSVDDVRRAWSIFGKSLRESDLNVAGILLPHRLETDQATQLYLLALYALTIKPALLPSFPSISAQFAQPTSDPATVWNERLTAITRDVSSPSDLAEVLKYTLRRLRPTPLGPLIDIGLFTKFVQQEHAASYPLDAYVTLLVPRLKAAVPQYLEEVFEVWSAMATHAEYNSMTAGRIAYLLGWWTWGLCGGQIGDWKTLYKDWQKAGQRMEHILYAWIRYQSTRIQIPIRLLEVVEKYPFGESTSSAEHLPLPPPSSFPRQTLHVTLSSSVPTAHMFQTPGDILKTTLQAKVDESTTLPLWSSVQENERNDTTDIVAEESLNFLRKAADASARTPPSSPEVNAQKTPAKVDDGPLYRPFSTVSAGRTSPRVRSFSQDAVSTPPAPSSQSVTPKPASAHSSQRNLKKQSSLSVLPKSQSGGSIWDDFQKSGFDDSPQTFGELGLAFSAKLPSTLHHSNNSNADPSQAPRRPTPKKRATFQSDKSPPSAVYAVISEELIEVDDIFLSFVEDAQLDPPSVSAWPPFVLVRLASPLPHLEASAEKPIEWLLVTVVHRPPPPPESEIVTEEPEPHARPTSPASSSSKVGTPRGFRDLASSFKRSTSFQSSTGLRRTFFGVSGFSLSKQAGSDELAPLPESDSSGSQQLRAPASTQSLTPTEYTVGEMGEIIKIPSVAEKTGQQNLLTKPPAPKDADEITIKGQPASTEVADTPASHWKYAGEGAEHIVFSYRGPQSSYTGKVIRFSKSKLSLTPSSSSDVKDVVTEWRDILLPKLVPSELLLQTSSVDLEQGWMIELLTDADLIRPEKRKEGVALARRITGRVRGLLMEDTTINETGDGKVTLAVEIKPKWGFLPSADRIQPPEAAAVKSINCRFCMHTHLRDESPSTTKYCPLDLYSDDEAKTQKALEGLWNIWSDTHGKSNNWRLFVDGNRITPDQVDHIPPMSGIGDAESKITPLVRSVLRSSKALDHLKTLQSTLDPTDISDLAHRFASAHPDASLFDPAHIDPPSAAELQEFVDVYLLEPEAGKKEEIWTLRQRMIAYALSAIFKDCSIFVKLTLARIGSEDNGGWNMVKDSGKVKIIDLDLKPIQNLDRWYQRDDEIWRHWLETHPPSDNDVGRVPVSAPEQQVQNELQKGLRVNSPVRPKAFSGLTVSEAAEDGASTRAMFARTPERTRENTPLPTPAPTTIDGRSVRESIALTSDEGANSEKGVYPDSVQESGDDEERRRLESLSSSVADPVERKQRSLAPSPSPSATRQDLPREEERPTVEPTVVSSIGSAILAAAGLDTTPDAAIESRGGEAEDSLLANQENETDTAEAIAVPTEPMHSADAAVQHGSDVERIPTTSTTEPVQDSSAASSKPPEDASPLTITETPFEMSLSAIQGENQTFFTPADTPLNLHQYDFPVIPVIPSTGLPRHTEDETGHKEELSDLLVTPTKRGLSEHSDDARPSEERGLPARVHNADAGEVTEGSGTSPLVVTPKSRMVPIEDATPRQEQPSGSAKRAAAIDPVEAEKPVIVIGAAAEKSAEGLNPFIAEPAQHVISEDNQGQSPAPPHDQPELKGEQLVETPGAAAASESILPLPIEPSTFAVTAEHAGLTEETFHEAPLATANADDHIITHVSEDQPHEIAMSVPAPQAVDNEPQPDLSTKEETLGFQTPALSHLPSEARNGIARDQASIGHDDPHMAASLIKDRAVTATTEEAEPTVSAVEPFAVEPASVALSDSAYTADDNLPVPARVQHPIELGRPITVTPNVSDTPEAAPVSPAQAASSTPTDKTSSHLPSVKSVNDIHQTYLHPDVYDASSHLDSHDLTTISEEGESSVPTSAALTRENTDISNPRSALGSEMGEQWVEDVARGEDHVVPFEGAKGEDEDVEETPKAVQELELQDEAARTAPAQAFEEGHGANSSPAGATAEELDNSPKDKDPPDLAAPLSLSFASARETRDTDLDFTPPMATNATTS